MEIYESKAHVRKRY